MKKRQMQGVPESSLRGQDSIPDRSNNHLNVSIMADINVYQQFFAAEGTFSGVARHAASILLISISEAGHIRYEAAVTFFPHNDPEDYAISYDAYFSKEQLLGTLREEVDALAAEAGAKVFWDQPLTEPCRG